MRYLLDTNACIWLLNNSSPPLVTRMPQTDPSDIMLCAVVKAELWSMAHTTASAPPKTCVSWRAFLPHYQSLTFDDRCAEQFGRIRANLQAQGTPIGPYDLMIAATAIANNLTLVTANVRQFVRVVGLQFEDWEG